ncbi:MAG: zinc ribbon domain-containing protein [Oscillospiraceae bacterium]|nr:zinc ribbon domain-containing protein [Oscillospiraceae bacterium]
MKDRFYMGDSWRSTFKNTMWVSVVVFEVLLIILLVSFSRDIAYNWFHEPRLRSVIIVVGIIVLTLLNEIIHSAWACIAYMFEDIARGRKANEEMLELLKQQNQEKTENAEEQNKPIVYAVSTGENKKVYRPVSERVKEPSVSDKWECPECGFMNPMASAFCKDCGHYK